MKPRLRAILRGFVLGVVQVVVMVWVWQRSMAVLNLPDQNTALAGYFALGIVWVAGLLVGYWLAEAHSAAEAFLASQFLADSAFVTLLSIFALALPGGQPDPSQLSILISLPVVNLLVALLGIIPGSFVGEWFRSRSNLSMDWRWGSMAIVVTAPVYALSLLTRLESRLLVPILIANWDLSLGLSALLVAIGLLLSIIGLYQNRFLKPEYGGLFFIVSLIAFAVSIVFFSYANGLYDECAGKPGDVPCGQVQLLIDEVYILGSLILVPGIMIFGLVFPKYWSSTTEAYP